MDLIKVKENQMQKNITSTPYLYNGIPTFFPYIKSSLVLIYESVLREKKSRQPVHPALDYGFLVDGI